MKLLSTRLALVLAAIAIAMSGCKGSAQMVGEGIDSAADKVKDAVTQPGPAEKAGRVIDRSVAK